jgi:hypothetical protein
MKTKLIKSALVLLCLSGVAAVAPESNAELVARVDENLAKLYDVASIQTVLFHRRLNPEAYYYFLGRMDAFAQAREVLLRSASNLPQREGAEQTGSRAPAAGNL